LTLNKDVYIQVQTYTRTNKQDQDKKPIGSNTETNKKVYL